MRGNHECHKRLIPRDDQLGLLRATTAELAPDAKQQRITQLSEDEQSDGDPKDHFDGNH